MIDKSVLRNCKRRLTNLSMAWIDYKKAYDMVPHSWLLECLDMVGVADNIRQLISNSMSKWKTCLTSNGQELGEVEINRGIFQGDSFSPLLFVIIMIPLTLILRDVKAGYSFGNNKPSINHLLFMDDLKLYGKSKEQISTLVDVVHKFSNDIKMAFGLDKCAVIEMNRGKMVCNDGIVLPNGEEMKAIDETGYKYLGVLQLDKILNQQMREKIKAEYIRRVKKYVDRCLMLGTLFSGNKRMGG